MEVTPILLTYNRPKVLERCLNTFINNTSVRFKELFILDDGSDDKLACNLFNVSRELNGMGLPTRLFLAGQNRGIGYSFEAAFGIMRDSESDGIIALIESDYIWRKGYLEDVIAVFEASPETVAIAGVDHPDMVDRNKTHGTFVDLMVEQFGCDLESREFLYNEFELETSRGNIRVRPVSNSCGCQFIHWGRLKKILEIGDSLNGLVEFSSKNYWKWMERAFHRNGTGDRRFASDAHMSGTISFFVEKYLKYKNADISKNFGMLSISDRSISSHLCGGGINGGCYPEGSTFVVSPTFYEEDLASDPRKVI